MTTELNQFTIPSTGNEANLDLTFTLYAGPNNPMLQITQDTGTITSPSTPGFIQLDENQLWELAEVIDQILTKGFFK